MCNIELLSSPPVFSGVRVTRSLVLCVCFVDLSLSFCPFSIDHCVVCSSSIYGFWLPLYCLQTLVFCPFLFGHCVVCPSDYRFGIFKLFLHLFTISLSVYMAKQNRLRLEYIITKSRNSVCMAVVRLRVTILLFSLMSLISSLS